MGLKDQSFRVPNSAFIERTFSSRLVGQRGSSMFGADGGTPASGQIGSHCAATPGIPI